jgi:hypothetical protein
MPRRVLETRRGRRGCHVTSPVVCYSCSAQHTSQLNARVGTDRDLARANNARPSSDRSAFRREFVCGCLLLQHLLQLDSSFQVSSFENNSFRKLDSSFRKRILAMDSERLRHRDRSHTLLQKKSSEHVLCKFSKLDT